MHITPGVIGVIDNPELATFLSEERRVNPMSVIQPPFVCLPTLLAIDPAHEQSMQKSLDYIAHAPNEVLLFAVLKEDNADLNALASLNGAAAVITRQQLLQDQDNTLAIPILCMRSTILCWKRAAIEQIQLYPCDGLNSDTYALRQAFGQLGRFDPLFEGEHQELALSIDGTWLTTDTDFPIKDKDALIPFLKDYNTSETKVASKTFLGGTLLLREVIKRGRVRVVLVVWDTHMDRIDFFEEVPNLQLFQNYLDRIVPALQVPFAAAIRDIFQAQKIAARSFISSFYETSIGLLDTLASNNPQEPAYTQGPTCPS